MVIISIIKIIHIKYFNYIMHSIHFMSFEIYYCYYLYYINYVITGWLKSTGSRVVYKLDHRKPVLYVIPIEHILGKLPAVSVGDIGTIQYHQRNFFPGAAGDHRPGAGDGCSLSTRGHWHGPAICKEWPAPTWRGLLLGSLRGAW